MRILELEFQMRSFSKRQVISFPENGMLMITGKRTGEDSGSGTGKSTIPMAIAFALDFCDLPIVDLSNWNTEEKPYVRLRLQSKDGNIYDIVRDPKLSIVVNGVPHQGTSSAAEELLKTIIAINPSLTKALTYLAQRSSDHFITSTDSQQKEFLTTVLNLTELEKAEERIVEKLKVIQNQHQIAVGTIKQIEAIESSMKPISDEELKQAYSEVLRLQQLRQNAGQNDQILDLQKQVHLIDSEILKINTINQSSTNAEYQNNQIRTTVEQIKVQIESLKKNICPTCKQEWLSTQNKIQELETQKQSLAQTFKANMATIAAAAPYKDPSIIHSMNVKKSEIQQQILSFSVPVQEAERNYQIAVQNYNSLSNQSAQYKSLVDRKTKAQEEEKTLAVQEHVYYHASQIGGRQGFLGDIFQEVLSEIEAVANEFISRASNVNTFILHLGTESVTQKGKVNKKITSTIWKSGKPVKLKSLSGGQQASIELAVELAVIAVVKRRSGIDYGWLILDESMDGMDVPLKNEWIETIKTLVDGLLIVIDHSTEIKELFDSVIEVTFDGQDSEIISF